MELACGDHGEGCARGCATQALACAATIAAVFATVTTLFNDAELVTAAFMLNAGIWLCGLVFMCAFCCGWMRISHDEYEHLQRDQLKATWMWRWAHEPSTCCCIDVRSRKWLLLAGWVRLLSALGGLWGVYTTWTVAKLAASQDAAAAEDDNPGVWPVVYLVVVFTQLVSALCRCWYAVPICEPSIIHDDAKVAAVLTGGARCSFGSPATTMFFCTVVTAMFNAQTLGNIDIVTSAAAAANSDADAGAEAPLHVSLVSCVFAIMSIGSIVAATLAECGRLYKSATPAHILLHDAGSQPAPNGVELSAMPTQV